MIERCMKDEQEENKEQILKYQNILNDLPLVIFPHLFCMPPQ